MNEIHTRFRDLLLSTKREGMDNVIIRLEELGFFKAPASTKFHLNYEGGLLEHSMNVCDMALELRDLMFKKKDGLHDALPKESVIIAALLHDVCKADVYKPAIKRQKNEYGVWCDVPGYDVDYSNFPLGHGEKSVIWLLQNGLKLTEDEIMAIRWHMGAWDLSLHSYEAQKNFVEAGSHSPLVPLLQTADTLAALIVEKGK